MIQTISLQDKRRTINTITLHFLSSNPWYLPKILCTSDLSPWPRKHGSMLFPCTREAQAFNAQTFKWCKVKPMSLPWLKIKPRELYQRLTTLTISLRDHGSKDTDDNWIKRKFLKAIMPFNKAMSSMIRQRPDFHTLSSSEVLDDFIAMNIMNKTADNALACVQ